MGMEHATGRHIRRMKVAPVRDESPMREGESGGRIAELDSLRSVAIGLVLVFHANEAWLPWGWAGVDLFFVLSGYLITSIVLKNGQTTGFLRQFYIRRGLRTWPIYYLLIGVLVLVSPFLVRPFFWSGLPYVLTYTQNLPGVWGPDSRFSAYVAHTWTLAVEEQFYLVWPLLVLAGGRRLVPALAVVCVCASVLARSKGVWFQSLFSQADGLALGGWLAAIRLRERRVFGDEARRWFSILPVVLTLSVLATLGWRLGVRPGGGLREHPGMIVLAFNLFWVSLLNLVLDWAGRPETGWLRFRPLTRLGVISYGVYLYHFPLVLLAHELSDALGYWTRLNEFRLVACILTIPIAALSWRYIERPLLGLKNRFAYPSETRLVTDFKSKSNRAERTPHKVVNSR
jgi:peptidoglycan/LPS O-acetylase OafA/YrhL